MVKKLNVEKATENLNFLLLNGFALNVGADIRDTVSLITCCSETAMPMQSNTHEFFMAK